MMEYFDDVTSKTLAQIALQENNLGELLRYEPIVRTKRAIELREVCTKFGLEVPDWLQGLIEDPNRWTEVAVRLDLGGVQDPVDALNDELGTTFNTLGDFKSAIGIVPIVQEVRACLSDDPETEAFLRQALEGDRNG